MTVYRVYDITTKTASTRMKMMPLSERPLKELLEIVAEGGGLEIDAGKRTVDELWQLVAYGRRTSARFRFAGCSKFTTEELTRIAASTRGQVIFAD